METKDPIVVFAITHSVLDGDTVDVRLVERDPSKVHARRRLLRIRLDGIDCPEDDQPWGDTATAGLIKMIGGRDVRIEVRGQDKYGRSLGTIFVSDKHTSDEINVNARMVRLGHAWVYHQFCKHLPRRRRGELKRNERLARARRTGLWRAHNPVPPWRWRNGEVSRLNSRYETEIVNDRLRLWDPDRFGSSGNDILRPAQSHKGSSAAVWVFAISLGIVFAGIAGWPYYREHIESLRLTKSLAIELPEIPRLRTSSQKKPKCLIKGNINWQGERIYYVPGTPFYDTAAINSGEGERWFCSEEEAVAAGWRAPEVIKPADPVTDGEGPQ